MFKHLMLARPATLAELGIDGVAYWWHQPLLMWAQAHASAGNTHCAVDFQPCSLDCINISAFCLQ